MFSLHKNASTELEITVAFSVKHFGYASLALQYFDGSNLVFSFSFISLNFIFSFTLNANMSCETFKMSVLVSICVSNNSFSFLLGNFLYCHSKCNTSQIVINAVVQKYGQFFVSFPCQGMNEGEEFSVQTNIFFNLLSNARDRWWNWSILSAIFFLVSFCNSLSLYHVNWVNFYSLLF